MKIDKKALEFEWDKGNIGKNKKHNVDDNEAEEVFFDQNKVTFPDIIHSTESEERLRIIGKTKNGRLVFIVFTRRSQKIRIISARDVNRKEVPLYEKTT
ncbi:MAG: hypothetical protein US86_C0005G0003 [Candidatus Daviesbacteria bacterium GW2011_GWA2_38_24]|uniref:Protein containing DUF497 n=1 Tax=Candidatus Daviesbacteria bacterium GW2011_GWA2_38_24 TaxID=1618422 RepID=A0A0G0JHZ3_9BACT|nr:MAG: hypothetical protein US86_C0005G0003 [Candidatus Daviesbacteria bacterium GW2011_GWA2_38_24]KKQ80058.1 MAG: hypothetical protein UT01_C0021G0009 [Candidatus Daviesbacteria bacterium GW2011_GWA1_38_7]